MVDSNAMRTHMTAAMSDASHDSKSLRLRVLRAIGHGHVPVHEHVNFLSRVASHSRDSIIFYALAGLFSYPDTAPVTRRYPDRIAVRI